MGLKEIQRAEGVEYNMTTAYRSKITPLIPEFAVPLARSTYYFARSVSTEARARLTPVSAADDFSPVFIVGCGRSGTTLLGELIARHPRVKFICEPYDLWAAVHPATDFLQIYRHGEHHCMLDSRAVTRETRIRFQRVMSPRRGFTLVEKSPVNALRLGFLDAIAPSARFVHIVRDGVEVAQSIERKASGARRMAFGPPLNNWWGISGAKWTALVRDGREAGYYAGEIRHLTADDQRGAYEWLVSVREINAWQSRLGPRLLELRLEDLISEPRKQLKSVVDWLGLLPSDEGWLDEAIQLVRPISNDYKTELTLPGQMRADFNELQESYHFKGRAISEES